MIEDKNGEVVVKMPGSVDGMQFIIQNLENCSVYIFDHIAQISIDDCKNCKFFIGPSKGSVFIRDCSDCSFGIMCQQYRTRDCKRITSFLSCATQPIIESSVNMKFGCISVNYNSLDDHLKAANISPFINNWNNIHDFTPVPGETNYTFLNKDKLMEDFITLPEDHIRNQLNVSFSKLDSLIPFTLGTSFRPNQESCLIVFFKEDSSEGANLKLDKRATRVLSVIKNSNFNLSLVGTKKFKFSETSADVVFGTKEFNNYLQAGPLIGLEYSGPDCNNTCKKLVQELAIDPYFITVDSGSLQRTLDNFYNFADMQMAV